MKIKLIFFIGLFAAFSSLRAQGPLIPNGTFAYWDTSFAIPPDTISDSVIIPPVLLITPHDWADFDGLVDFPYGISYQDDSDVAPGSAYSVGMLTDTVEGQANNGVATGFVSVGSGSYDGFNFYFSGIPFIFRPDTLFFDYEYTSPGTDTAGVFLDLVNSDDTGIIGSGDGLEVPIYANSSWTSSFVVLTSLYVDSGYTQPDSLYLMFYSSISENPVYGSLLHIDNVRFGYANVTQETVSVIGPTTFCAGDSVILSAPTNADYSYYQWYSGNDTTPVAGANASYYSPYTSGSYYVIIDSSGTPEVSTPVTVVENIPVAGSLVAVVDGDTTNNLCFPSPDTVYLYASPPEGAFVASGIIADSSSAYFVPYNTGSFVLAYFYTDSNDCSSDATDTVDVTLCTGIKSVTNSTLKLNLFPDPASNTLNIVSNQDVSGFTMQLFDATGSLVSARTLEGLTTTVNVSELASGAYIIQVIDKQNTPVSQNKFTVVR